MVEEKAIVVEVVTKVTKEEAAQAMEQYKKFVDFEDKVNEAVYVPTTRASRSARRKLHGPSTSPT